MTENKNEHSPQHKDLVAAQELKQHEVAEMLNFLKKYGKIAGIAVAAVLILVLTISFLKSRQNAREIKADQLLLKATNVEAYKTIAETYKNTPAAAVAILGEAKEYFNAANYDAAEKLYRQFLKKYKHHEMAKLAEFNLIMCQEAYGRFDEARNRYSDFASMNKNSYLAPMAIIGKARCLEALKKFDEARSAYEDLMAYYPGEQWSRIAQDNIRALRNKK